MTSKGLVFAMALAMVVAGGCWWFSQPPATTEIVITTGSKSGVYYRVGQQIADSFLNSDDGAANIECVIRESDGSAENIKRLENGAADVAIVQNDALAGRSVRSLAMLYTETLHLICHRDKSIDCLNDLDGLRINFGSRFSGTHQLVEKLLSFARVEIRKEHRSHFGFAEAEAMLNSGEVDAAFFLVGLGAEVIERLLDDRNFVLVPIQIRSDQQPDTFVAQTAFIEGFRTQYPYVAVSEIPLMAYGGQPKRPTPSLGIGAVLACREDWDPQLAKQLVATTFANKAVLARNMTLLSRLDEATNQVGLQFPLHRGAEAYYRRNEPGFLAENAESIGVLITVALLLASGLHAMKKWIDQRRKNRVDVYYQRVQDVQSEAMRLDARNELTDNTLVEAYRQLRAIETEACDELICERVEADHAYLILQNMIARCRAELAQAKPTDSSADINSGKA